MARGQVSEQLLDLIKNALIALIILAIIGVFGYWLINYNPFSW